MQTWEKGQNKFKERVENMKFEHLGNEHFVKMFGNMYDLDKRFQRRKELERKTQPIHEYPQNRYEASKSA